MVRTSRPSIDANTAAYVHRMLKSDALPAQLLSIVNNEGELTTSADELADSLSDHFHSVFTCPPPSDAILPHPVPEMLQDKSSVHAGVVSWTDARGQGRRDS